MIRVHLDAIESVRIAFGFGVEKRGVLPGRNFVLADPERVADGTDALGGRVPDVFRMTDGHQLDVHLAANACALMIAFWDLWPWFGLQLDRSLRTAAASGTDATSWDLWRCLERGSTHCVGRARETGAAGSHVTVAGPRSIRAHPEGVERAARQIKAEPDCLAGQ